jgi:hypothetical protein
MGVKFNPLEGQTVNSGSNLPTLPPLKVSVRAPMARRDPAERRTA